MRGANSIYLTYAETVAQMQPSQYLSAARQAMSLQSALQCLQSVTGGQWFPTNTTFSQTALHRLGFRGKVLGLTPRPVMPYQTQTADYILKYLDKLGDASALHMNINDIPIQHTCSPPEGVEELTAQKRFSKYAVIKARQKRHGG